MVHELSILITFELSFVRTVELPAMIPATCVPCPTVQKKGHVIIKSVHTYTPCQFDV